VNGSIHSREGAKSVDEKEIARRLLLNFGIRIEPEMSAYARRQLDRAGAGQFPIMGAHARTGVPMRTTIDAAQLRASAASSSPENARDTY
jgi:hypothetical protein